MAEFDTEQFIESPHIEHMKQLNKDQLLYHLGVHVKKSQNQSVIYSKIFQYDVSFDKARDKYYQF